MAPQTATAPPQTAPLDFEVWELKADTAEPSGRLWHRIIPDQPALTRGFDKGRSFYFGDNVKKTKLSKTLLRDGDYIVVDLRGKVEIGHYVPSQILGDHGDLFLREAGQAKAPNTWKRLVKRSDAMTKLQPNVQKLASGTAASEQNALRFLNKLKLPEGTIVAARPILDDSIWDALKNGGMPDKPLVRHYAYSQILGEFSSDLEIIDHNWFMSPTDESPNNPEAAKLKKMTAKGLADALKKSGAQTIDAQLSDYENRIDERVEDLRKETRKFQKSKKQRSDFNGVVAKCEALLLEAVPSALPGSTAPHSNLNTVMQALEDEGQVAEDFFNDLASGMITGNVEAVASGWAMISDIVDIVKMSRNSTEPNEATYKTKVTDLVDHTAKLGAGVTNVAEMIYGVVHGTSGAATTAALGGGASIAGGVIGLANAGRMYNKNVNSVVRIAMLMEYMLDIIATYKIKQPMYEKPAPATEEPHILGDYIYHKMKRRASKQEATIFAGLIGGTTGVIGGVVAVVGTVAVVNAWNPIGWTLMAAGLAIGLGVVGYSIFRWARKGKRHRHRRGKNYPGTVGQFSDRAMALAFNTGNSDEYRAFGLRLLQIFDVHVEAVDDPKTGKQFYVVSERKDSDTGDRIKESYDDPKLPDISNQSRTRIRSRIRRHVKK